MTTVLFLCLFLVSGVSVAHVSEFEVEINKQGPYFLEEFDLISIELIPNIDRAEIELLRGELRCRSLQIDEGSIHSLKVLPQGIKCRTAPSFINFKISFIFKDNTHPEESLINKLKNEITKLQESLDTSNFTQGQLASVATNKKIDLPANHPESVKIQVLPHEQIEIKKISGTLKNSPYEKRVFYADGKNLILNATDKIKINSLPFRDLPYMAIICLDEKEGAEVLQVGLIKSKVLSCQINDNQNSFANNSGGYSIEYTVYNQEQLHTNLQEEIEIKKQELYQLAQEFESKKAQTHISQNESFKGWLQSLTIETEVETKKQIACFDQLKEVANIGNILAFPEHFDLILYGAKLEGTAGFLTLNKDQSFSYFGFPTGQMLSMMARPAALKLADETLLPFNLLMDVITNSELENPNTPLIPELISREKRLDSSNLSQALLYLESKLISMIRSMNSHYVWRGKPNGATPQDYLEPLKSCQVQSGLVNKEIIRMEKELLK